MKILFVQLPLIDHTYGYIQGNIEYAPASIAGYIRKKFGGSVFTETLPFVLSNFGSESAIARYVLKMSPDIVCFTSYIWNIERSLEIAQKIKKSSPGIKIVFGGPEIGAGSIALSGKRDCADCFVSGEGEWFFDNYLSGKNMERYAAPSGGNVLYVQPEDELILPGDIVEPYTAKMLDPMFDGSIYLELTRGCPYRCSYCYYSKNCNTVRELRFDILVDILKNRKNLREIYILSPALNSTPGFIDKLRLLAKTNKGVRLHSEMRASGIDNRKAGMLYDAGFRSMEVGIQTLNKKSLKLVGRNSNTGSELRGMEAMKRAGIDLKIGIIPGLPADTPDDFLSMIDRLVGLGFGDDIEFYPLMILPGTGIRDHALRDGINFQKNPPYYYHGGWGFSFDDLISARRYVEAATGYTMSMKCLPNFISRDDGIFNAGAFINGDDRDSWAGEKYHDIIETNVFSFHVKISDINNIYDGLPALADGLPAGELYNFIFYTDCEIGEQSLIDIFNGIERDNFTRRLNIFDEWVAGLCFRCYQIFSAPDKFSRCLDQYSFIHPVLRIDRGNSAALKAIDVDADILVAQGSFPPAADLIAKKFSDRPEQVAFENEGEQAEFYRLIGYEHIALPFGFSLKRMTE